MSYEEEKAKNERLVKEKAQQIAENNAAIQVAPPVVAPPVPPSDNAIVNVPAPVAEQPLSRTEQLMQQLYSTRESAPVHDQAKEDRLRKMAKINMIGRAIGVAGDALTMGLGGNVRKSQPDKVAPMLYQQYQALMDKEKADQDSYKYRSYQNERANLGAQIGEEHRKDALKLNAADKEYSRGERARDLLRQKDNLDYNRKYQTGRDKVGDDARAAALKAQELRDKKNDAYRASILKASQDRAAAKTTTGKPYTVINSGGKNGIGGTDIPLTQGQHRAMYEAALKSEAFKGVDLKALLAQYSNQPLEGERNIIQRYNTWLDEQRAAQQPVFNQFTTQPQANNPYSKVMLTNPGVAQPTARPTVRKQMPDGRIALFDSATKTFVRYE